MSEECCIFTGLPVAEAMGITVQDVVSLTPTANFKVNKAQKTYAKKVGMGEANGNVK